jgi:hypothetical protein
MAVDFEPEHLLGVLVEESVEFVLVGGYAALVHGATRPTQDVDVTPATDEGNLTRPVRALKRLDARIRTDAVPDGLPFDTSPAALRGVLMLNLTTKFGDLDLTFTPSGTAGYPDLSEHAERAKDLQALTELHQLLALGKNTEHRPGRE